MSLSLTAAPYLKQYLDTIGFHGIYKYVAALNQYYVSPFRITPANHHFFNTRHFHIHGDRQGLDLLRCLALCCPVDYDGLTGEDQETANSLLEAGLLSRQGRTVQNAGYQVISWHGFYVVIDARINFPQHGSHQTYIGIDSYCLCYYGESNAGSPRQRALDLCAGTGIGGLFLSKFCRQVVSTDIKAEALALTRFNCLLNERQDVLEIREQELAITVDSGERYDILMCNPPFVALPSGLYAPEYAKGTGPDGLGYLRRLFEKSEALLTDNGAAYFVADLLGDAHRPYFLSEVNEYAKHFPGRIDVFIDTQIPAAKNIRGLCLFLHRWNPKVNPARISKMMADMVTQDLNAQCYYLTTFQLEKGRQRGMRVFFRDVPERSVTQTSWMTRFKKPVKKS